MHVLVSFMTRACHVTVSLSSFQLGLSVYNLTSFPDKTGLMCSLSLVTD